MPLEEDPPPPHPHHPIPHPASVDPLAESDDINDSHQTAVSPTSNQQTITSPTSNQQTSLSPTSNQQIITSPITSPVSYRQTKGSSIQQTNL